MWKYSENSIPVSNIIENPLWPNAIFLRMILQLKDWNVNHFAQN